ncbi:hypothetical protein PMAYCL1PPCAC_00891, partial [Pristionchus mayeri]
RAQEDDHRWTDLGYGVAAGQRLVRRGIRTVKVQVRGLGPGRMTSVKGRAVAGVNAVSITDHALLPELGPDPGRSRASEGTVV